MLTYRVLTILLCAAAALPAVTAAKPAAPSRKAAARVATPTKSTAKAPVRAKTAARTATAKPLTAKPVTARTLAAKPATATKTGVTAKAAVAKPASRRTTRTAYRPERFPFKLVSSPNLDILPDMVPPLENLGLHELGDSFSALRMGRLRHNAIDIMRPLGDPLVAVVDGVVEKLYNSRLGGITLYLVDKEKRFRFYYAHLERYADGIEEGLEVRMGDVLGFVGKTGNAKYTDPHLHFQVMTTEATGSWWKASEVLNPYPILRDLVHRQLAGMPRPFVGPIDTSTIEEPPRR